MLGETGVVASAPLLDLSRLPLLLKPRRRAVMLHSDSLADARLVLSKRRGRLGRTTLNFFTVGVLKILCEDLSLVVASTGKQKLAPIKPDYVLALVNWVRVLKLLVC